MTCHKILIVAICFTSSIFAKDYELLDQDYYDLNNAAEIFKQFNEKFEKQPDTGRSDDRFQVFKSNLELINKWNEESGSKVYGITEFVDLTFEEFKNTYIMNVGNVSMQNAVLYKASGLALPTRLDYRQYGYVSPVKNQKTCGSCYAFSSTGNIEGQFAKKYGKLVSLSEQQIVDCARSAKGCGGGWPDVIFRELASKGGLMLERDYPYQNVQGQCREDKNRIAVKVTGGQKLILRDEASLKDALVQFGPLAIVVFVNQELSMYKSDTIFKPKSLCNVPYHAMVLVGYGNDGSGDYWIIKNSYGTSWGHQGYIKFAMGENVCGIGMYAASATVA